jgi:hypothetical protein
MLMGIAAALERLHPVRFAAKGWQSRVKPVPGLAVLHSTDLRNRTAVNPHVRNDDQRFSGTTFLMEDPFDEQSTHAESANRRVGSGSIIPLRFGRRRGANG